MMDRPAFATKEPVYATKQPAMVCLNVGGADPASDVDRMAAKR
jgi:hypothetical protein